MHDARQHDAECDEQSAAADIALTHELRPYTLFMFLLSVYVLAALVCQSTMKLDQSTLAILNFVDYGVCLIFFVDFWINLYAASDKWAYLKWGWIDLVSSLPMVDAARAGRLVRVFRVLRALRSIRLIRVLANHFIYRRSDGAFFAIALLSILLVLFSSIGMLQFETATDSNIRTPEDALWWAFATITTVGYGDKYPVTTEGRVLAAMLMVAGVGMFGSITGVVASWVLSPSSKDREQDSELALLRKQIDEIHRHLKPSRNSADDDLARIVAAWPSLPPETKAQWLALTERERSAA